MSNCQLLRWPHHFLTSPFRFWAFYPCILVWSYYSKHFANTGGGRCGEKEAEEREKMGREKEGEGREMENLSYGPQDHTVLSPPRCLGETPEFALLTWFQDHVSRVVGLNHQWTVDSPEKLWKVLLSRPCPRSDESDSPKTEPRQQYFSKVPSVSKEVAKVEEHRFGSLLLKLTWAAQQQGHHQGTR